MSFLVAEDDNSFLRGVCLHPRNVQRVNFPVGVDSTDADIRLDALPSRDDLVKSDKLVLDEVPADDSSKNLSRSQLGSVEETFRLIELAIEYQL